MTAETIQNTIKTFRFSFPTCTNEDLLFKLEVPVEIPHAGSTRELVQRLINMFHIPVYLEDELNEKLAEFVYEETKKFHNERDETLLNKLKNGELNVEGTVKKWEKQFKENIVEYAEQKGSSEEEVFAAAYHKLVHSPALETILQVENSYATTVIDTLKNRDEDIKKLTERQTEEMEEKVRLLNISSTEEDINELATRHFEEQSFAAGRWGSQLDALKQAQRARHRAWLMDTLGQYHEWDQALHTPENSPLATFCPSPLAARSAAVPRPALEESFTIHLGSQLKQTHNVRIVAMDMMQLCTVDHNNPLDASRRLQTALSLYSSELSACVVVSAGGPSQGGGTPLAALQVATAAADHHFPALDAQLRDIEERLKEPVEQRNISVGRGKPGVAAGDVFITRHSNLPDVHLVFHLVGDDAALRAGDITSRHPAMLGLRNVLKAAACNDVSSISIPLLLRHELSEETTAAWCLRRAELVLKCVKGFVIECGSAGGGACLATIHFVAPPNTAPDLFAALANLLPTIFRTSNPVKAKTKPA
ncbi:hypothetical protein ACJJTC_003603 [Scirpophaga incertulas]